MAGRATLDAAGFVAAGRFAALCRHGLLGDVAGYNDARKHGI